VSIWFNSGFARLVVAAQDFLSKITIDYEIKVRVGNSGNGQRHTIFVRNVRELRKKLREGHAFGGAIHLCYSDQIGDKGCLPEGLSIDNLSTEHFDWLVENAPGIRFIVVPRFER